MNRKNSVSLKIQEFKDKVVATEKNTERNSERTNSIKKTNTAHASAHKDINLDKHDQIATNSREKGKLSPRPSSEIM